MAHRTPSANELHGLRSNLRFIWHIAWNAAPIELAGLFITSLLGALTPIAMSLTLRSGIDALNLASGSGATVLPIAIVTILAARAAIRAANDVVFWILGGTYFELRLNYKLQNALTLDFHNRVGALDLGHLEDAATQNRIMKARESLAWRPMNVLSQLSRALNSSVTFIGSIIVLLPFGWWLPVALAVSALPRLILRVHYSRIQYGVYNVATPITRKLWYLRMLLSNLEPVREGKILGSRAGLLGRIDSMQQQVTQEQLRAASHATAAYVLPVVLEAAVLLGVSLWAVPGVLSGAMTIGAFTLLLSLSEQMSGAMAGILMNLSFLIETNLYITDIRITFELPPLLPQHSNPVRIGDPNRPPHIEFRDVRFAYPGGRDVLHRVSFTIEPGQRTALVGANGAGKSTIVKLLCRFYDVTDGQVLLNGIDIRTVDREEWYRNLATLFQEFERYRFTIRDVISLGYPHPLSDADVRRVAQMSGADRFIEAFPNGYDEQLGREFEGQELSAGQWQKLAIARAFARAAPVLVLDEPTSAIDALSEEEIFRNLEQQYVNKTLLLISHRFSTVRGADEIIVLEDGRISERGPHAKLLQQHGTYARMFEAQAKGYS